MKTYDLDNVLISQRIYSSWLIVAQETVGTLRKKYSDIKSTEIPDEQFRVLADKTGEIFIKVRNTEIKYHVPKNEYKIK